MARIIHFINSLCSGGAEVFVTHLVKELSSHHNITLLTYAGELDAKGLTLKNYLLENNIEYYSFNAKSQFSKILIPIKLALYLKKRKTDIVHAHLYRSCYFLYISNFFLKNKVIQTRTFHSTKFSSPFFLKKHFHKSFSYNFACSNAVIEKLKILQLNNVSVINNGINTSNLTNSLHNVELRKKLKIPLDKIIFLQVGYIYELNDKSPKAHDVVLKTITNNFKNNSSIFFIFLGDGPGLKAVNTYIIENNLSTVISSKGIVSNVNDYLSCADAFLMPSRFEGLPISAIEAACQGIPLILSNIPSFNVFKSNSVLTCIPNSEDSLKKCLHNFISERHIYRNNAIKNTNQYQEMFSIKNTANKYNDIYNELLS